MDFRSLDQLLHQALKQSALTAKPQRKSSPHQRYLNPQNWTSGKLIELIYDDGQGLQSLGLFREWNYRLPPGGRRLARLPYVPLEFGELPGEPVEFEFCYGEWWIEAKVDPYTDFGGDSPEAIRERLIELLEEFEL